MCYSAQVRAGCKKYVYVVGHENALDIKAFFKKYWQRITDASVKIPKAFDAWFLNRDDHDADLIRQAISE